VERPKDIKLVPPEQMVYLQDYWETFGSERGKRVLNDMKAKYCKSCFDKDPYKMAFLNGQREVILEIEETMDEVNQTIQVEEE
jgi:hypothetical protein